jgi:hypothetical protein
MKISPSSTLAPGLPYVMDEISVPGRCYLDDEHDLAVDGYPMRSPAWPVVSVVGPERVLEDGGVDGIDPVELPRRNSD